MFPFPAHVASAHPSKAPERVMVMALINETGEPRFLVEKARGHFDTVAIRHVERVEPIRRADEIARLGCFIAEAQAHGCDTPARMAEYIGQRLWSGPTSTDR